MKLVNKFIVVSLAILSSMNVNAADLLANGGRLSIGPNQIIKIQTPFLQPGIVAGNEFTIKVVGEMVFMQINRDARSFGVGDIYIFDSASKPVGQMQTTHLVVSSNSGDEKRGTSEYKLVVASNN